MIAFIIGMIVLIIILAVIISALSEDEAEQKEEKSNKNVYETNQIQINDDIENTIQVEKIVNSKGTCEEEQNESCNKLLREVGEFKEILSKKELLIYINDRIEEVKNPLFMISRLRNDITTKFYHMVGMTEQEVDSDVMLSISLWHLQLTADANLIIAIAENIYKTEIYSLEELNLLKSNYQYLFLDEFFVRVTSIDEKRFLISYLWNEVNDIKNFTEQTIDIISPNMDRNLLVSRIKEQNSAFTLYKSHLLHAIVSLGELTNTEILNLQNTIQDL